MSRKHYRAVAEVIASAAVDAREVHPSETPIGVVEQIARELADVFKRDNSAFSYTTFYEACGIEPSVHVGRR